MTGKPLANSMVMSSGSSGADMGDAVNFHMSAGGSVSGSSRIPRKVNFYIFYVFRASHLLHSCNVPGKLRYQPLQKYGTTRSEGEGLG